jgi:RNA polymerase sigma factor (sigma-70 family)
MERAEVSDAQLAASCRSGDDGAWSALVQRFSRYVYAICAQGFHLRGQDAEDVFQEVFTKVYEQLGNLRKDEALRPWIGQLTRRACIDRFRASSRATAGEYELADTDDVFATIEEAMSVRQALGRVGEPCGDMLDRFFAQDQSYRTIGDELGLPAGTIASRISRCLEKLRAAMEDSDTFARLDNR